MILIDTDILIDAARGVSAAIICLEGIREKIHSCHQRHYKNGAFGWLSQ